LCREGFDGAVHLFGLNGDRPHFERERDGGINYWISRLNGVLRVRLWQTSDVTLGAPARILMNPAGQTSDVKLGAPTNILTNPDGQTSNAKLDAPPAGRRSSPLPKRRRIRHGFGI
jgi:hypothetical protein